jgi:hypothetical protein
VEWEAIVPDSWISRITRSQLVHDPIKDLEEVCPFL